MRAINNQYEHTNETAPLKIYGIIVDMAQGVVINKH